MIEVAFRPPRAPMIAELTDQRVECVESFGPPADAPLFDEERSVVAHAVERRRREFADVRECARRALGRLNVAPAPILPGLSGSPVWPAGIVGSMTHCDGYRAAMVAGTLDAISIGIDAEPHRALPDEVVDMIETPAERRQRLLFSSAAPDIHWDTLLFCIKESVYKAWFPLTRVFLEFDQATVAMDPARRSFQAELAVPAPSGGSPPTTFGGRWLVRSGLVVTATVVPVRTPTRGARPSRATAHTHPLAGRANSTR